MSIRSAVRGSAALIVCIALTSCSGGRSDADGDPCGGDPPLCYPATVVNDWCHVELVRDGVVAGRLTAADLPSWVDLTERDDGRPQVYDFTATDPNDWPRWSDDLRNSVRAAGKSWDPEALDECADDHDVEDVIASEGVPR